MSLQTDVVALVTRNVGMTVETVSSISALELWRRGEDYTSGLARVPALRNVDLVLAAAETGMEVEVLGTGLIVGLF